MSEKKAEIFGDRRQCLVATAGNAFPMWAATIATHDGDMTWYGLAATEHQFKLALVDKIARVKKVPKQEVVNLLVMELKDESDEPA